MNRASRFIWCEPLYDYVARPLPATRYDPLWTRRRGPLQPYDPAGGNYYSNPHRSSAANHAPQLTFYFWLGTDAEGFHARP